MSQFQITTLSNGVRVATRQLPTKTVLTAVFANVGARCESKEENGLSHFLEHMAFKGTPSRDAKQIVSEVELLGSSVNAFTSRGVTAYFVTGLSEYGETSLDILADVIQNSLMDPEEIAREQEVVVQEIAESNDDIDAIAFNTLVETAFPDQPTGRPILGPEENVRSFTTESLKGYVAKHYHADNLVVVAVGDVDHDEFVALSEARFSGIARGSQANVEPAVYVGGQSVYQDDRFDQAQVFIGFPAPGVEDDSYAVYDLLGDVLGGGMSSPLFHEVREKRGLCYSVGTGLIAQHEKSVLVIQGSTTPKNLNEFISVSAEQLGKIAKGEVDPADFTRAKNTVKVQVAKREEKAMSLARAAVNDLFIRGSVRDVEDVLAVYDAVTLEDVIAAAKGLLDVKMTVVVAGNAPEIDYEALVSQGLRA